MFRSLPPDAQQQAIEKHIRWQHGEVTDPNQWHPIQEWKHKADIWQLTIGDYRAFAKRVAPRKFEWYWIGNKQAALNLLTSSAHANWYRFSKILNA